MQLICHARENCLDLIRKEGADKKSTAKILEYGVNGLGLSLMVVTFAGGAGIAKGAQASAGVGSAVVGQRLLEGLKRFRVLVPLG